MTVWGLLHGKTVRRRIDLTLSPQDALEREEKERFVSLGRWICAWFGVVVLAVLLGAWLALKV